MGLSDLISETGFKITVIDMIGIQKLQITGFFEFLRHGIYDARNFLNLFDHQFRRRLYTGADQHGLQGFILSHGI